MKFVGFMLRMLWIERLSGVSQGEPVRFGVDSFDRLWQQWRPIISDFLHWLWRDQAVTRWNSEVLAHVESTFLAVHRSSEQDTISQTCERIEEEADRLREKLNRGEVCLYDRVNDKSMFKFTETLFYAYLGLLADRFGEGEILLDRRADGRPKVKPSNAKALFDPIGGIFTHDPRTRRERFRYRSGLTMSLWDLGQKEKKRLVLSRLNRESPAVVASRE